MVKALKVKRGNKEGKVVELEGEELEHFNSYQEKKRKRGLSTHLSRYRYEIETGGITVSGVKIQTDRASRANIIAAYITAKEDPSYTIKWKTSAGFVTLDSPSIILISEAVRDHVQKCFAAEAAINPADYDTIQALQEAFDQEFNS